MSTYDTLMQGIKKTEKKEDEVEIKKVSEVLVEKSAPIIEVKPKTVPEVIIVKQPEKTEKSNSQKQKVTQIHLQGRSEDARTKRHPFDIFEDQLISLADIQHEALKKTGKKPTLGELAREALDDLIKKKSH